MSVSGSFKLSKKDRTDPNAPKKSPSGYFMWLNQSGIRVQLQKENPQWTGSDKITKLSKIAGAKWKEMADDEKKPYLDKAAAGKLEYQEALKEYKESDAFQAFEEEKKVKLIAKIKKQKIKDPNRPKKALTAYFLFLKDFRSENPKLKLTQTSKAGGAAWKALSEEEQKPYKDQAAAAKAAKQGQLAQYEAGPQHAEYLAKKEAFEETRKRQLDKLEGRPAKRQRTDDGYSDSDGYTEDEYSDE